MFDNGNDAWLRYKGKDGEWAVSYHGTAKENIEGIMIEEYKIDKSKRFEYGIGIYSSPFFSVAEVFAKEFSFNGKNYKIVFQNRINQRNMQIVKDGNYFLSPDERDLLMEYVSNYLEIKFLYFSDEIGIIFN